MKRGIIQTNYEGLWSLPGAVETSFYYRGYSRAGEEEEDGEAQTPRSPGSRPPVERRR